MELKVLWSAIFLGLAIWLAVRITKKISDRKNKK